MKSEPLLEVRGLSRHWRAFSLSDVDLAISEGDYCMILGENGAGKTLLLETILGFHRPDSGKILVNGTDVTLLPPEARGIGFVPQDPSLFPHMSVRDNIEFGLRMRKVPEGECRRASDELLDLMNLVEFAERRPASLSGGEIKKTALARAFAVKPRILLLDEPLSSIDQKARSTLMAELKSIHDSRLHTILHVTHDQDEAYSLADKVAVMRRGKIAQLGTVEEIYRRPVDVETAEFLGFNNLLELAEIIDPYRVKVNGVNLSTATDASGCRKLGIRSEDILLRMDKPSGKANVFRCTISNVSHKVTKIEMMADIGFKLKISLSRREYASLGWTEGDELYVEIPPDALRIFS